jgi:hypothetical protein
LKNLKPFEPFFSWSYNKFIHKNPNMGRAKPLGKCRGYGKKSAICKKQSCIDCLPKTFASQEYSKQWSAKNTIQPFQVNCGAEKKCWFDCEKCGHEYDAQLKNIIAGSRCPYCVNLKRCDDGCDICYLKSFASHPKSEFWSIDKNELTPFQIALQCNDKFWFDCPDCGHEYDQALNHIVQYDYGCPYCVNQKRCVEENCDSCFDRSFASHDRSVYWSDQNILTAREVARSCDDKFIFDCECGNTFPMSPAHIVTQDTWCPKCGTTRNKGMERFTRLLLEIDPGATITPEFPQRIEGRLLHFDAHVDLSNGKTFKYESDGEQHFTPDTSVHFRLKTEEAKLDAFQTIYKIDRMKEKFVMYNGEILFRASYRQFYLEETMRKLVGDMVRIATAFDGSDMCGQVTRMDAPLYQEILSDAFKSRYNL